MSTQTKGLKRWNTKGGILSLGSKEKNQPSHKEDDSVTQIIQYEVYKEAPTFPVS